MNVSSRSDSSSDRDAIACLQSRIAELEQQLEACQLQIEEATAKKADLAHAECPDISSVSTWNLTERTRTELELQQSRDLRAAFFNESTDAIFLVDAQTLLIIDCNRRAIELFEASSREALLNISGNSLQKTPFTFKEMDAIAHEVEKQGFWSREIEYITLKGNPFWGSLAARRITVTGKSLHLVRVSDISDRKRSETVIREQEQFLRSIYEGSGNLIFVVDVLENGSFQFSGWSLSTEKATGIRATEIIGKEPESILGDSYSLSVRQNYLKCVESKTSYVYEECRIFNNQETWWLTTLNPLINELDTVYRLVGTTVNITDRKQAEQALHESEEKFQQLIEAIESVFWIADLNGVCFYVSPGCERLLGDSVRDLYQMPWFHLQFVHPDDIEQVQQFLAQQPTSRTDQEYRIIRPNGEVRWLRDRSFPILNKRGEPYRIAGIADDITEQKQTEAILRESNRRWQVLLDEVQLLVLQQSADGTVEYVNPYFLKAMGYAREEIVGKNGFATLLPARLQMATHPNVQAYVNQNAPYQCQSLVLTRAGEERVVSWKNTPLRDTQGGLMGLLCIGEDITEQRNMERIKAEFISIVSHELRTPLTSINGALELLSSGLLPLNSERGRQSIEIAGKEADRLTRLVNDILDLERLESGKLRLEMGACNLAQLMTHAGEFMQLAADEANIHLVIQPLSVMLVVDSDRITQVLTNLLLNAIKFSSNGSTIWLTAKLVSAQLSPPGAAPSLFSSVQLTVRDQGRGIPTDKLESIFERFQQVDASDSRRKGGTGLGLAICRSIVQQHGGTIWAESILNLGSQFHFTLPLKPSK